MDPFVFAAVLFAAACHAGWNATIKRGLDPLATTVLISIGAAHRRGRVPAGRRLAGGRRLAMVRRVGAHSSRLFRRTDRELPRRRHGTGLPDRTRVSAADDRDRDHLVHRRAPRPARLERHRSAGGRGHVAVAARRPRSRAARRKGGRVRLVHRGDDLRLFGGGWRGRAARRQRQCLFGRAVRGHRSGHGDLRARPARRAT